MSAIFENILVEIENSVAWITINRPAQLNALNKATIEDLSNCLQAIETDENVRVLVITGSGNKAFVAGADIKEFAHFSVEEGKKLAAVGQKILFDKVANFPKPIIAAVNGFALGGGLELAMSAHFRVASNNAKMGLPEVTLGVIPGYGGTQRLSELVGKGKAMEMVLSAAMITASEANALGLVNYTVEQDDLKEKCNALAASMVKNSPLAIRHAIRCINAGYQDGVNGYEVEIDAFGKCFGTADFTEGTTAFIEKRKATFTGK